MSMEDALVDVPKTGIEVVFRLQSGSKIARMFNPSDNIELLYDFVFLKLTEVNMSNRINFYLT